MASGLDFTNDGGTFGIVQFHTDFDKGLCTGELVKEGKGFGLAVKVQCDDYVFTH